MSNKEGKSPERLVSENQCGVILGYWDHEKTPALIQDLEQSVNLVERKCKNLLEELIYYKRYLEEFEQPEVHLEAYKNKGKKWKNTHLLSGSDPEIAFRKNVVNQEETREIFEEKFQQKLANINKELGAAGQKLGLNDSIILFPAEDYLRALRGQMEHKARKCWSEVRERFMTVNRFKRKTSSESILAEIGARNETFSKITKDELELYQKLSKLSLKGGKTVLSKSRKVKYCCRKKCPRMSEEPKGKRMECGEKKKKKKKEKRRRRRRMRGNGEAGELQRSGKEAEVQEALQKGGDVEAVGVGTVKRKLVPFTGCTSTSRSYNVGLNIQQLLSVRKRESVKEVKRRQSSSSSSSWVGRCRSDGFESEEVRKVWVSKRCTSSNVRKVRSRYTGRSGGGIVEYHKSTMRQYTNGQKSMIKSESKSAYAVGSKIMVSGCERTDVFEIGKEESLGCRKNASGDGTCNDKCRKLSMEWRKVYSCFLETYRKYTSLKEKLSEKESAPSNEELKCLENEIDEAVEKYKDFLEFYSKHRLKSLKIACESKTFGPVTSFASGCHRKVNNICRPTSSMALKKAFKEVEALQEKIRLLCD